MAIQKAKFSIGDVVKHKHFEFRGVIYDVDFEFKRFLHQKFAEIFYPLIENKMIESFKQRANQILN